MEKILLRILFASSLAAAPFILKRKNLLMYMTVLSYQSKPLELLMRSLFFSVPMTLLQWFLERKTDLFRWKSWSLFHTFASINFTLFTIRGFVGLLKRITPEVRGGNFVEERSHNKRLSPKFIASTANHRLTNDNYVQIH